MDDNKKEDRLKSIWISPQKVKRLEDHGTVEGKGAMTIESEIKAGTHTDPS